MTKIYTVIVGQIKVLLLKLLTPLPHKSESLIDALHSGDNVGWLDANISSSKN